MSAICILSIDPGKDGAAVCLTLTTSGMKPLNVEPTWMPDGDDRFWPGTLNEDRWMSIMRARDEEKLLKPDVVVIEGQAPHAGDGKFNATALHSLHRTVGAWQALAMAMWPGVAVVQPQWSSIKVAVNQYVMGIMPKLKQAPTWEQDRVRIEQSSLRVGKGSELKVAGYHIATSLGAFDRKVFINNNDTFFDGRTDALALGVGAYLSNIGNIATKEKGAK